MAELHRSGSLVRSVSSMGRVLRKQIWIWPLIAVVGLGLLGWWVRGIVEGTLKRQLAQQLETLLATDVTALEAWLKAQENQVTDTAANAQVKALVTQLVELSASSGSQAETLLQAPQAVELRNVLKSWLKADSFDGFIVLDREGLVLAAGRAELVGKPDAPLLDEVLPKVLAGKPTISRPFKSMAILQDADGNARAACPRCSPWRPSWTLRGEVIACLGMRIRPEHDFSRILAAARPGESGETYALDRHGLMLSHSRFDEQLKRIGLLADRAEEHSILNLEIRDPQVDMTRGERPSLRRSEQPLTRMAAEIASGTSGADAVGYRDYRGTPVVGAWRWLPEYGLGIATEMDLEEAERPLHVLRNMFWGLLALLAVAAAAIFVFTILVARVRRSLRHAVVAARQLGQYALEEKLGEGGMGVVYKARHAFLRRPTAVKLLDVDKTTPEAVARFEREVQLTSQLNHPNTIAIFDFGHTPEGVFYYAMEYLDGIPLDELVRRFGPQSEGRVIHLLRQVCGSLAEAHESGLIHRDIKPANIMLNRRGGIADFIKVLDFGLVRATDSAKQMTLTAANSITGTPQYLSPEGIEHPDQVDARSDLYAVGAVGYFLLTGTPVFQATSLVEICMQQVHAEPDSPSRRRGADFSPDLEGLILRCLAKRPVDRPQSARQILEGLASCQAAGNWTSADAEAWWQGFLPFSAPAPTAPTHPDIGPTIVLDKPPESQ